MSISLGILFIALISLWVGAFLTGAIALFRTFKLNASLLDQLSYARWTLALFFLGTIGTAWIAQATLPWDRIAKLEPLMLVSQLAWFGVGLWAIGTAYILFKLGRDQISLKHFGQAVLSNSVSPKALNFTSDDLSRISRLKINFATHKGTSSPFTFGFDQPVIVLPQEFETRFSSTQCRALLLHEIAHIQRRDYIVFSVLSIVRAIFWFNPFYTYLANLYADGVEFACDEFASQQQGSGHAIAGALGRLCLENDTPNLVLGSFGTTGCVAERIGALVNAQTIDPLSSRLICIAYAVTAGCAATLAGISFSVLIPAL